MLETRCLHNQKNYRHLLRAMSRPGRSVQLELAVEPHPFAEALTIGECLLDCEVSFSVIGCDDTTHLENALRSATQVRPESVEQADFLFILGSSSQRKVLQAKRGHTEAPELGATLIYLPDLGGTGTDHDIKVRLSGPGIAAGEGIAPEFDGIAPEEYGFLMEANADYPLGLDIFLVRSGGKVIAIPRSTRIRMR